MGEDRKGFFGALLDLSFTSFVTTRVVKVLYVLTIVLLVIAYAGIAIAIFSGGDEVARLDENGQITTSDDGGNVGLGIFWLVDPRPAAPVPLHAAVPRVLRADHRGVPHLREHARPARAHAPLDGGPRRRPAAADDPLTAPR